MKVLAEFDERQRGEGTLRAHDELPILLQLEEVGLQGEQPRRGLDVAHAGPRHLQSPSAGKAANDAAGGVLELHHLPAVGQVANVLHEIEVQTVLLNQTTERADIDPHVVGVPILELGGIERAHLSRS